MCCVWLCVHVHVIVGVAERAACADFGGGGREQGSAHRASLLP